MNTKEIKKKKQEKKKGEKVVVNVIFDRTTWKPAVEVSA